MTSFSSRVAVAASAIRQVFPETPLQENDYLSKKTGARVLLKREDLSPVRSYKSPWRLQLLPQGAWRRQPGRAVCVCVRR